MMSPGYVLGQVAAPRPEEPEEPLYVNAKQVSTNGVGHFHYLGWFLHLPSFEPECALVCGGSIALFLLFVMQVMLSQISAPRTQYLNPIASAFRRYHLSLPFNTSHRSHYNLLTEHSTTLVVFLRFVLFFFTPFFLPLYFFEKSAICFLGRDPEQRKSTREKER